MSNLARQHEIAFGANALNIDQIAKQKDQDYANERTWWIFEDGSALGKDSNNIIYIKDDYGLHVDHEQLNN